MEASGASPLPPPLHATGGETETQWKPVLWGHRIQEVGLGSERRLPPLSDGRGGAGVSTQEGHRERGPWWWGAGHLSLLVMPGPREALASLMACICTCSLPSPSQASQHFLSPQPYKVTTVSQRQSQAQGVSAVTHGHTHRGRGKASNSKTWHLTPASPSGRSPTKTDRHNHLDEKWLRSKKKKIPNSPNSEFVDASS